jgi:hypothetical protein
MHAGKYMSDESVVRVDLSQEPGEYGMPAVLVENERDCEECGHVHEIEVCPRCGAYIDIVPVGYSPLGFGTHKYCTGRGDYKFRYDDEPCRWSWHEIWPLDAE